MEKFSNLRRFFEEFKNLSFWQRLFSWKSVRASSYAAYEDLALLGEEIRKHQNEAESFRHKWELLSQERDSFERQLTDAKERFLKMEAKLQHLDQDLKKTQLEKQEFEQKSRLAEQREDQRRKAHDQSLQEFLTLKQSAENEKAEMKERALRELAERNEEMKETWKRHEDTVQNAMKAICQRHAIEYVESVPFKGKPDNVISICDEYIVFDAKSPAASDDLTNFNTYIRAQAEAASKYTSCDAVRKDIYLVVPSNTLDVLKSRRFDLGNYTVTVLTVDALEPVIESLKRLEEYEFVEQLCPEDRQSICRIVGSYIYMTKRRIQVDQDLNSHALELLSRTNREIPEVMHDEISKHERAMKINPPVDRRSKVISQEVLEKTQAEQEGLAKVWEVPSTGSGTGLSTGSGTGRSTRAIGKEEDVALVVNG